MSTSHWVFSDGFHARPGGSDCFGCSAGSWAMEGGVEQMKPSEGSSNTCKTECIAFIWSWELENICWVSLFSCGTLNRRTWAAQDKDTSEQYLPRMSQMILASLEEDVLKFWLSFSFKPQESGPTCSAFEKLVHFRCWVCEALSVCHAQVADGVTQWRWDWNIKDSFSMTLQCPLVIYMILSQWTHLHNLTCKMTCKHVCSKVAWWKYLADMATGEGD